jgi:hypothetical protein
MEKQKPTNIKNYHPLINVVKGKCTFQCISFGKKMKLPIISKVPTNKIHLL